mmetsp:Transcript_131922/g.239906  ORF Transcript_131922/g.239906 Transcript_131922/m.239906 type:complete len:190 (+) Transcript_131922:77-646(+)
MKVIIITSCLLIAQSLASNVALQGGMYNPPSQEVDPNGIMSGWERHDNSDCSSDDDDECNPLEVAKQRCEGNEKCTAVYGYLVGSSGCWNNCIKPPLRLRGDRHHYDGTQTVWIKPPEKCDGQDRFDIIMCKSYACTECTLPWCVEKCQQLQNTFPLCRCADWPSSRLSYSNGEFAGKGKHGDVGDYSK